MGAQSKRGRQRRARMGGDPSGDPPAAIVCTARASSGCGGLCRRPWFKSASEVEQRHQVACEYAHHRAHRDLQGRMPQRVLQRPRRVADRVVGRQLRDDHVQHAGLLPCMQPHTAGIVHHLRTRRSGWAAA